MWYIWLIFAGIFVIIEAFTVGFLIFWLSIGSIFAMITSFFTDNLVIQTAVFVISSTLLIFVTKPFVNKFTKNKNTSPTNVYSLIGKIGLVTKEIDSIKSLGQIKVNGEIWSAVDINNGNISEGTEVKIVKIKGVKVIVTPVK